MTEKRFKYKITDGFFDGDVLISIKEVVDLLNEQQSIITTLKSVLRKECNIITDEDLLEYVKTNGVSLNE